MTTQSAKNFSVDTKGSCFMCLKYDAESPIAAVSPYSFQRLSKYLQLDFQNVYNISFPTAASVSVFSESEIEVSLCIQCSVEANKFVKLHKDLELIKKRVNTCVGRIHQLMVNAEKEPNRVREYRERVAATASPLDLIQASIAESLRKETIKNCDNVNASTTPTNFTTSTGLTVTPVNISSPKPPKAITPTSIPAVTVSRVQNDTSLVSSTTASLAVNKGQAKEILLVDLDDSDGEDSNNKNISETESELVIKSVTGSSAKIFATTPQRITLNSTPPQQQTTTTIIGRQQQQQQLLQSQTTVRNVEPSTSFSALQNFTTDFDFDLPEGLNTPPSAEDEEETWRKLSDGRHQCKFCGKIFDKGKNENMMIHARMHAGVKPVECQHCDQTFRSLGNRRIHILTYHRSELFSQYHYPAVSKENFQCMIDKIMENKRVESGSDKPYGCVYCAKYYRHKIDVEAHMMNVHFNELGTKLIGMQQRGVNEDTGMDNTNDILKRKENVCFKCGVSFQTSPLLMQHIRTDCRPNDNITLQQHSNTTSYGYEDQGQKRQGPQGQKCGYVIKYKCGICSVTFASEEDLKQHKAAKHIGVATIRSSAVEAGTTYKCQYCEKKFKFYYSQRVHMFTLHRLQVFARYVPVGTAPDVIDKGIERILENSKISVGSSHACKYCRRDFPGSVEAILQNHILVSHFREVVSGLQAAVNEVKMSSSYTSVERTTEANKAVNPTPGSVNLVEMILPH